MEENVEKRIDKKGKNAIISLCLLIIKLFTVILTSLSAIVNIQGVPAYIITGLALVPWLLLSLIFAIIGRAKDKDKLSKILLIVDIVLIVLEILFVIAIAVLIMLGAAYLVNLFGAAA